MSATPPEPGVAQRCLGLCLRSPGVAHRWVTARDVTFHIAEAGAGDDPVLLLHGWPQHWYEWRHLMPVLARRHRVIALDLRGFGWSDAPRTGYLKEDLADDVLAVLDALGLERVKLVGHDWGGWIGFLLCLRSPQRFERFLALNICHPWPGRRRGLLHAWRFWYMLVLSTPGLGYLAQRTGLLVWFVLRFGVHDRSTWEPGAIAAFTDVLAQPARARAGVRLYRAFTTRELPGILRGRYAGRRLTVPTLVVFGTEDPAISPQLLDGYEQHADDMRVELVPHTGHFIAEERPELVAERALSFLA